MHESRGQGFKHCCVRQVLEMVSTHRSHHISCTQGLQTHCWPYHAFGLNQNQFMMSPQSPYLADWCNLPPHRRSSEPRQISLFTFFPNKGGRAVFFSFILLSNITFFSISNIQSLFRPERKFSFRAFGFDHLSAQLIVHTIAYNLVNLLKTGPRCTRITQARHSMLHYMI